MTKPILLTVDDDPSVSRAVARDLRRRYAEHYRVVRADSGADALESLQEIRLRGDRVAVLLADYRMPNMNGIEFLEQAMDLFPRARRALLTAYADTDAAIEAINLVDVDYYLLKPWEPPEEKLFPVVDQMLETWKAAGEPETESTRIIGHRWSAQAYEVRDFLARNGMPYSWFTTEEAEGRKLLEAAGATEADVPVLLTAGGDVLLNPTLSEVADKIGLSTTPAEDFYDLVIVGGGPAGLGAAVYGASEGLRTVLVEGRATGGQAGQSSRIENYLGFPDGVSGGQLTDRARRQATRLGAELLTARRVVGLATHGPKKILELDDGSRVAAHAVLLATGVSYRRLGAEGADDMVGRGVFYGSAATEADACADQHVVIVGGANSAGQAAMFFSRQAARVTLAVRAPDLERSMSHYLIQQIRGNDRIDVRTCTEVISCHGDGHLQKLVLRDSTSGATEDVDCGHLFVFIGAAPMTDWLPDELARDQAGFVLTGTDLLDSGERPAGWTPNRDPFHLETSIPGVFVAGDVRSASVKRVASAVGEGAMAVTLVHQYLAHP
ncbi:FAD-dependent oxidoreductase [Kineosporia corallincola]|uniref:FAD-dependent oxidoreductase n=1 Tax=Kineosporia corallincola TaxID=2835133 RepID=UPI0027E11DC9|nr:FAD-dependent oxidoreductase [Kineosporia corallincola]